MIQELFNQLLDMEPDERKIFIKNMSTTNRQAIIDMMWLPRTTSQKRLCFEIEETARFIRTARSGSDGRK